MRSSRFTTTIALATTLGLAASGVAAASPHPGPEAVRVVDLRTDNKSNPIGIDSQAPLLAWKLDAPEGGRTSGQRAYEIRAAHSVAQLRRGIADVWKSGKVDSSATNNIAFAGDALRSRESVAWQVRVWTQTDMRRAGAHPPRGRWACSDNSDWSARWIENASYDYTRPDGSETPLPVFGKSFTVHGRVAKARLYMTGLGMYASTLNGARGQRECPGTRSDDILLGSRLPDL